MDGWMANGCIWFAISFQVGSPSLSEVLLSFNGCLYRDFVPVRLWSSGPTKGDSLIASGWQICFFADVAWEI